MSKMITVVLAEPGKKAKVTEIENLQKIVGGYIECVYPFGDNVGIICNEEGKLEANQDFRYKFQDPEDKSILE